MPLTKTGKKLKSKFKKEYGKKGESIFYAFENKHKGKIGKKKLVKGSK